MNIRHGSKKVLGFVLLLFSTSFIGNIVLQKPALAYTATENLTQTSVSITLPMHMAVAETDNCGAGWALDWIACPLSGGLLQFVADMIRNVVADLLYMDTNQLFSSEFKTAWTVFQRIGFAVIIISGLIMVISHSLGLEIFDAYTIRKLLPRLIIAIVGMALAWPILKFVITFFNDIGVWTHDLIVKPFENIGNDTNMFNLQDPKSAAASALDHYGSSRMEWGIIATALLAGAIQVSFLGPAGILSLVATIALAVLIGVATLVIRQIIIMVTVLFAPLAIACYVLPGTKKIANFWQNTLTTALIMFPIVMALIGVGEAMSRVAASAAEDSIAMKLLSILVYFAPYFMLPMAFKMAGGLMSNIFGMVNDRSRGAFDRLRNFRDETKKRRKAEYATGAKHGNNPFTRATNRMASSWAARTSMPDQGGFSLSAQKQRQFQQKRMQAENEAAKKKQSEDGFFAMGDTDATRAAMHATSAKDFIQRYTHGGRHTEQEAMTALGRFEGMGVDIGSRQARLAAARGHFADKTTYWDAANHSTDFHAMAEDMGALVDAGLMSDQEAASMMSNEERPDYNVLSFSEKQRMVNESRANAAAGRGYGLRAVEADHYRQRSYEQMRSSGAMFTNQRAAEAMGALSSERTTEALTVPHAATEDQQRINQDRVAQEFATLGAFQAMEPSASQEAKEQFAATMLEEIDLESYSPEVQGMFKGIPRGPKLRPDGTPEKDRNGSIKPAKLTKQDLLNHLRDTSNPLYTARDRQLSSAAALRDQQLQQPQAQIPGGNNPLGFP